MKKITILICCLLAFSFVQAQYTQDAPWMSDINVQARKGTNNPVTFQEVVDAFNTYWETRDPNVKGSGYKPFKRWETHWKNFVKEDGTLPTQKELWDTYLETKSNGNSQRAMADESDWQPKGPFTHSNTGSWSSGQGRVNVIVKDDANTYYAGAPAGGLWKTTDNGVTWETNTDNLPQIGVSGIAIDYNNPGTIYIATGDDDGGDSNSVGVMKSTDGGLTWETTGLNAGNTPGRMNDIYINPNDSNMLWVATNSGLFKTTDAGVTWASKLSGNVRDIKIKPGDTNIIYATTSAGGGANTLFHRSFDEGESFSAVSSGLPAATTVSRMVIDVTAANPNVVYVLAADPGNGFRGIYKSTNSGLSFSTVATVGTVGNIFESTQSWFDLAFAVSDTNENEIYTGVLNVWKGTVGTNGQATFVKLNNWNAPASSTYTHADIHFLRFFEGELLVGSDGGFYKSNNAGVSFSDVTAGMQISQFYRIAVSKQTSEKMVGGLQDNGGHAYNNNQWQNYYGADGMDTAINPNNPDIFYGFIQFGGTMYVSSSAGAGITGSVNSPAGENGAWITPLTMSSSGVLYSGYRRLYKIEGQSQNWQPVSEDFGSNLQIVEVDEINPNIIFVATQSNVLRRSVDGGATYTVLSPTSNFTPAIPNFRSITSVEVNTTDNNIVYATTSGTGGEVYKSTDGGLNFTSISSGLPSVTKNMIKHQALHSKNPLFLGTSLGVYRYDDDTAAWELFNIGLPNVTVTDLEINVIDSKITAATYGRGIWQSEIPTELAPTDIRLLEVQGLSSLIACNTDVNPEILVKNNGISTITSVDVIYTVDGVDTNFTWTGSLASEATTLITIPTLTLGLGVHTFSATTTIANDTYDTNNSSLEQTILINDIGVVNVVNTFDNATDDILVLDEGASTQYWQRGVPTGTLLNDSANPTNQVYGTNLSGDHGNNIKSYLVTGCYDLTTMTDPELKFDMAFELEENWDIVYVEYSTDQGVNWSVLGTAADPNWYNSDRLPGADCTNCPGAQWTGTAGALAEYRHSLTAFLTEASIMFRIVFHSDPAEVREGAIVNDLVVRENALSVEEFEADNNFVIFPNPSTGVFNIKTTTVNKFNINVYDVTGKVILQQNNVRPDNNTYALDISEYASGVYFLNISTETSKVTKKIILN
jgi:hypothetical protein